MLFQHTGIGLRQPHYEALLAAPPPLAFVEVHSENFFAEGGAAVGVLTTAQAQDKAKEKCFGVAKAGANDCANLSGTHSCAGQSKNAMGADEWNYVAKGTCAKMGGKSMDEAKAGMMKK